MKNNTLTPYVANLIGTTYGHGEDKNTAAQLATHAILGGALAYINGGNAAAGAGSAVAAESIADYLTQPYKDNLAYQNANGEFEANRLPEDVKSQIRDLSSAIGAVVGGVVGDSSSNAQIGGVIGQNAVENNNLSTANLKETGYEKFEKDLAACKAKSANCTNIVEAYWKEHERNHASFIEKCTDGGAACVKWEELLLAELNDTSKIKDESVRNLSRIMIAADLLIVSKNITISDRVLANLNPIVVASLIASKKINPSLMSITTAKETLKTAGIAASIGMTNEALFEQLASGTIDYKKVIAVGINSGMAGAVSVSSINANKAPQPLNIPSQIGKNGYIFKLDIDTNFIGKNVSTQDAVALAFSKTGVARNEFKVTKWGVDKNGKSFPVEYRVLEGKNRGAEVSIDLGHTGIGTPGSPHVGWQTPGKKNIVGHIFLDDVNVNRSKTK